jgi:hypothetical protein
MSARNLEAFLARVYVDPELRARFRSDPAGVAAIAGLSAEECLAMERMDWTGLVMASRSFHKKRQLKKAAMKNTLFRSGVVRFISLLMRSFWPQSRANSSDMEGEP